MSALTAYGWLLGHCLLGSIQARRRHRADAGLGTLEMVIIALGLMAVAGLLVAALTVAVTRRTNQIR